LAILSKVRIKKNALFHEFSFLATKIPFDGSKFVKLR